MVRLSFEDIFPSEDKNLDAYIFGISKKKLINISALLIAVSTNNNTWQDHKSFIFHKWFSLNNYEIAHEIYNRIIVLENTTLKKYSAKYRIVDKIIALKFLENVLALNEYPDNDLIPSDEIEVNIFKCILRLNTIENRKDAEAINSVKEVDVINNSTGLFIVYGLSQYEIINTTPTYIFTEMLLQIIKAKYLFEFLSTNKPILLSLYFNRFNCKDFDEFLSKIFPLFFLLFTSMKRVEGNNDTYDPTFSILNAEKEEDKFFLDNFLISSNRIDEDIDFISLRSTPIISPSEGEYVLLNDLFIIQKIFNGTYFDLKRISDSNKITPNFRSYFTTKFSEEYLFYNTMNSVYKNRTYKRLSGSEIKDKYKIQGEPDYYVRNGNKIFIYESKDIFMSAQIKWSYNLTEIKNFIDKKLVYKEGIPQIVSNIKRIINGEIPYDNQKQAAKSFIYPIIVTYRAEFDTPGLNMYLKEEFERQIEIAGFNLTQRSKIRKLTIINIDFFILFEKSLKNKNIELDKLIDDYHHWTIQNNKTAQTRIELFEKRQESFLSFFTYTKKRLKFNVEQYTAEVRDHIKYLLYEN